MSKVLVIYHSFTGKCQKLAEAAAEGARSAGSDAVVKDAAAVTAADLSAADAVIIGTPSPSAALPGRSRSSLSGSGRSGRRWARESPWGHLYAGAALTPQVASSF